MSVAIKVEEVSKLYRLGEVGTGTISHDLNRWWHRIRGNEDPYTKVGQVNDRATMAGRPSQADVSHSLFSRLRGTKPVAAVASGTDYVWALRDVSLEVEQGEILGIIGRNGAGKSTLLKLLSRTTAPSTGSIKARGRIASLLEVGTGMHPELTGRENIYLNGAILGMKRAEITKQLDAIVDFSGCAKYIDTPVKRYSSGMNVRLGFAVAAHLECEILIVDEVLAVGDADFQRRCIGKMREVGSEGRTVLLISHNMGSISSLCKRTILLDRGSVILDGETSDVVLRHLGGGEIGLTSGTGKSLGDENGELVAAWTEDATGKKSTSFSIAEEFNVVMDYRVNADLPIAPYPNFHFFDERGQPVLVTSERNDRARTPGVYRARCHVPARFLNDGAYFIGVALTATHNGINPCFFERDTLCVNIVEPLSHLEIDGAPRFGYGGPMPGVVRPSFQWSIERHLPEDEELVIR